VNETHTGGLLWVIFITEQLQLVNSTLMHGLNNREREVIALASNPYQEEAEKRNTIKQT
jgi:hypothetical protein